MVFNKRVSQISKMYNKKSESNWYALLWGGADKSLARPERK